MMLCKKRRIILGMICGMLVLLHVFGCAERADEKKTNERGVDDMDTLHFTVMSQQEAAAIYPAGFDVTLAKEKGLICDQIGEEKYQRMEAAYLTLLNEYLEMTVNLTQYENSLSSSGYTFYPVEDSLYYRCRSYGRKNLYLRNNAYIERLSKEQLALLEEGITELSVIPSTELMNLVETTWKDVIAVHLDPTQTAGYPINYELKADNDIMANSDALTFILGYCIEYDSAGNTISDDAESEKYKAASALCKTMERELSQKLDTHVKIFIIVGDHLG